MALPLLAACSHGDDSEGYGPRNDGSAVYFTATASGGTRTVTVPDGALSTGETFRVYATKTLNSITEVLIPDDGTTNIVSYGLINPEAHSYDLDYGVSAWHTAAKYYWDTRDYRYNFYAVYPTTAPAITDDTDVTITYTVDTAADTDLLYACHEDVEKNTRGIPLTFHHALCSVTFNAQAENGVTFTINTIQLEGIQTTGTFDFASASWTADDPATPSTTTYYATTGNALLLMPQTMTDGARIVIQYKVLSSDGTTYLRGTADSWATKTIALSGAWPVGRNMTYTLTANEDITLSCSITDWQPENGGSDDFEI